MKALTSNNIIFTHAEPGGSLVRKKRSAWERNQRTHPHRLKAAGAALSRCDVVNMGTLCETAEIFKD